MFQLIPFLSYVFVVTFTPGPNNILSMVNATQFGYKKTLNFILGIFTGFTLIMLLCSYFNLFLFNLLPKVKIFMGLLGAGYMLYLAYKIMSSKNRNGNNDRKLHSFYTGMTLQFVNPKVILYGITVISNFIIPYYNSHLSLIFFSIFLSTVAFVATSCWAFFGVFFEKFLAKYRPQFNVAMGLLLIYSAISISDLKQLF